MKNENILILTVVIIVTWLTGLTWGILNIDYKISQLDYEPEKDTVYIQDTLYLDEERQ